VVPASELSAVLKRRCTRRNVEAGANILSCILAIASDMSGYGYCRVLGILRNQHRHEVLSANTKQFTG